MSEFFFVVKTALFSFLMLMVLQMKISGSTIERHSENWIYHSRVGGELQTVARGAVRAGFDGWSWVVDKTETKKERSSRSRPRSEDVD